MKRISKMFMLVLGFSLILTGCGKQKTLTCTKTEENSAGTMNIEDVIIFENGYAVKNVTTTKATFVEEESANSFAEPYKGKAGIEVEQNGKSVTIVETSTNMADYKVTMEVKEEYENDGWKCN